VPGGSFGYNLIVNKSNIKYKDQLAAKNLSHLRNV
jgi:nitronate monooxygenase